MSSPMSITLASSERAQVSYELVQALQSRFVQGLESVSREYGHPVCFQNNTWQRDGGLHGGGGRAGVEDTPVFGRGSVNISQVHYDDLPDKRLSSASALSTIIHPKSPHIPSVHIHISYTEMRDGSGYWRMMADLNPSIPNEEDRNVYTQALRDVSGRLYEEAAAQGDQYFYIPALQRHRGVTHFYLEGYDSGSYETDRDLAQAFGQSAIDSYVQILSKGLKENTPITNAHINQQLTYHTTYFFQVLTLDRGTTSGLLIHDQNDVGILGSLPPAVDRTLLSSWRHRLPSPQGALLDRLVSALPEEQPARVGDEQKVALAQQVRAHYQTHPEALNLQASGYTLPPTVSNHK